MDEKKVKLAVRRMTKDPAMKKQYHAATSMPARRLRELSFYYMWFDGFHAPKLTEAETDECYAEMIRMQQKMELLDWSYIYKCTINRSFKRVCKIRVDYLRHDPVPAEDWEFLVEHLPDFDPFKETAKQKLAEAKAQEGEQE